MKIEQKREDAISICYSHEYAPVVVNSDRELVELHVHPVVVVYQVPQLFHIILMHNARKDTDATQMQAWRKCKKDIVDDIKNSKYVDLKPQQSDL